MADSNTETAAPAASESGVEKGSEFANPVGVKDDEIWAKHFGKGKESEPKTRRATGSRESRETSDGEGKGSTPKSAKDSKGPSKSGSERPDSSTKQTDEPEKPKSSSSEKSKPKDEDSTESTGRKTADDDKAQDPQAPLKKARDLLAEAKKADDPREARKLYKRAMKEAFGEVPEEFDDSKYAAVRKERKAAKAALDAQAQKNEGRIQEAAEKLKPAIFVMRQLEGAGLADKLTVPMVERTLHVMKALRSLEDGDFTQLAEVVSRATGVDHDEAMKRFVKGVKVSPEGRASRQAAEAAERRAAEAQRRIEQLEARLNERETQRTEAEKKQAQERQKAEARAAYLEDITLELDGHPILKLQRGPERVMAYLIKTANKSTRTARYSPAQAADKIVAFERKRVEGARFLVDGEAPARTEPRSGLRTVARAETVDAGVKDESPEASFGRIYDKYQPRARAR